MNRLMSSRSLSLFSKSFGRAHFGTFSKIPRANPSFQVPQWQTNSIRFMATKAEKSPSKSQEKVPSKPQAQVPDVKATIKKELLKTLTREIEDTKTLENPDKSFMKYLEKSKFKLIEEEGVVTLTSQQPTQLITVSFSTTVEPPSDNAFDEESFMNEEEGNEMIETEAENPEAPKQSKSQTNQLEEEEGEMTEEEMSRLGDMSPKHSVAIELSFPNKKGQLRGKWVVEGQVSNGQLALFTLQTVDIDAAGQEGEITQAYFDALSPEFQEAVQNYLADSGIDGELVNFVEEYVENAQPANQTKFLHKLQKLLIV